MVCVSQLKPSPQRAQSTRRNATEGSEGGKGFSAMTILRSSVVRIFRSWPVHVCSIGKPTISLAEEPGADLGDRPVFLSTNYQDAHARIGRGDIDVGLRT